MSNLLMLPAGQFLGRTLRTHDIADVRFTETFYPDGMKQPEHAHEQPLFCFVLAGSYVETVRRQERTRQPLALGFHPVGSAHAEAYTAPGRHLLVELGTRWMKCASDYGVALDAPVEFHDGPARWLLMRAYQEFREPDSLSPLAIEGALLELLAETSRRSLVSSGRRPPRWLERATDMLHERFSENLVLADVAADAGVHVAHLARVFRKFKGCTVGDYLRQLRIEYATRRISSTTESLAEIAAAAGFSDQSHLSRAFRRHTGMAPSEFRATLCDR